MKNAYVSWNPCKNDCLLFFLWLDDARNQEVQEDLGQPAVSRDGAGFWIVSETIPMNALLPKLFRGGWGMFFFRTRPKQMPIPPIPLLPSKRPDAAELIGSTEAQAVIVSWYDDLEWLVAFNCPDR